MGSIAAMTHSNGWKLSSREVICWVCSRVPRTIHLDAHEEAHMSRLCSRLYDYRATTCDVKKCSGLICISALQIPYMKIGLAAQDIAFCSTPHPYTCVAYWE